MKLIITICCSIIFLPAFAQTGISWSAPATVADASYDNLHPRIATDAAGNALVIWGDAIGDNVFFSKWNGSAFSSPIQINPVAVDVFAADWAGPDMAASGDTVYVVYKQQPEDFNPIYLCRSFDGGITFSDPFPVENIADSLSRFPTVTVNASGNPVVGFMKFNADFLDSRWVIAVSGDYGATFSADVKASGYTNAEVCDCCPGSIAIDGNTIAMLYRNNNENLRTMWASVSSDNGISFPTGLPVDDTDWSINICPSSGPDGVIIDDSLYTVFMSGGGGPNRIYLNTSTLTNPQSTTTSILTGNFTGLQSQNYPRISNHENAVAIVWKQVVNNAAQIALAFTTDIKSGIPVNYDVIAANTNNSIANADVSVSNGKVHAVWQDNSDGTLKYISGSYGNTGQEEVAVSSFSPGIFPNPCSQFIFIRKSTVSQVAVYNLHGQKVNDSFNPVNQAMDVSSLSNGFYILKMSDGQNFSIQKIAIQQ